MQITLEGLTGSGELWLDIMKIICGDTSGKSMVDLGCHHAPYTPLLGFKDRTYVDIQDRPLDHHDEQKYFRHSGAITFLTMCDCEFHVSIASDFLEHLTFQVGKELLHLMKLRSSKQVVFTPLGDASITLDEHPDSHASGWVPNDFPDWLTIALPNFHESINLGAFFACDCTEEEKQRIYNEIKIKYAFYDKN